MDLAYLVGQAMLGAVGGLVIYVAANYYLGISEASLLYNQIMFYIKADRHSSLTSVHFSYMIASWATSMQHNCFLIILGAMSQKVLGGAHH